MKRWTFRIVFCLLLGVVTTVGVAGLILAIQGPGLGPYYSPTDRYGIRNTDTALLRSFGYRPKTSMLIPSTGKSEPVDKSVLGSHQTKSIGARERTVYQFGETFSGMFTRWLYLERFAGWPYETIATRKWSSGATARSIGTKGWLILPGFLINTLFYAVIWFGLFFGVGAARRVLRRKRGCCEKCGYDLRGTPDDVGGPGGGCSECGLGRED